MSDLSSNDTLDPHEKTTPNDARDANVVDNTPEDWESIIDFEMKNGKEDVTMGSSQENGVSLANRLQAEEENLQKGEDGAIEIDKESISDLDNTGAAHDEYNNSMTIEEIQLTKPWKQTIRIVRQQYPKRTQALLTNTQTQVNTYQFLNTCSNGCCKRAS